MAYREAATGGDEILLSLDVSTSKGGTTVGILLGLCVVFLVTLGVSVVAGAPPAIEPYVWTFGVAALVFAVPAALLWAKRKRKLHVLRNRGGVRLVVPAEVELAFPLTASGAQHTEHLRGIPIYHVYLKLVDGDGRGIFFKEARGAIHGPQHGWFDAVDRTTTATSYDLARAGDAARIRELVADINQELRSKDG